MKTYAAILLGLLFTPLLQADVLINLDATSLPAGALPTWTNTGTTVGNFTSAGSPTPSVVSATYGSTVVKAVILGGANYYLGPVAPGTVTATSSPRTIEAWVYNPAIAAEETIMAWGRRGGGPDGSNMSFNYGSSTVFGAAGHWGAAFDMGWYSSGAASPAAGVWRYLVYTYNGTTATVYVDGVQTNSKTVALNTHAVNNAGVPVALKFVVGQQNEANGTNGASAVFGSIRYGRLRVRNELLTPTQITNTFAAEAATFGRAQPVVTSFTASPSVFLPGQNVTLTWTSSLATTASINQGVGSVATNGSVVVSPTAGTTYTLTVNGTGSATANVTVTPFAPPALTHRWSFSEASGSTVVGDSVGTSHGTILGAGATRDGTKVTLPGGSPATQAYIDLPNGLLSSLNEITIEGWMTINGSQNWSRYFDFGTGTAGEILAPGGSASGTEYLTLTAQVGAAQGTKRLALRDNNVEQSVDLADATTNGQQFHYAVVYKADGNSGAPQVRYYKNGALIGSLNTTFRLQDIADVNNWLGRSNWTGDNNTQGDYNEFRIWNAGLSAGSIADTAASGPDSMPQAPRIDVFTALPSATIYRGESVRLSYLLSDLASLGLTSSIDQGVGALPGNSGYVTVAPNATTTYTLTSTNSAATRTATVTITVLPSEPISSNLTLTTNYETAAPVTLSATDPNTPQGSLVFSIVTPPAYGVLTGTGAARTYTPNAGYSGPDTFSYKANDGLSDSNIATVTITVYPPPTAPTNIVPSETVIFTNAITGTFIARLRPVDANPTDTHTLTLVAGVGDTHNAYFSVNGNQLISGHDFSGDVGQTISIRVRVTDNTGFTFEKVLTFAVQVPDLHVKINEVNFNSARNTQLSEFIELYNPFGTPVNIGGWHFTKGVDYTFPANTMIPANGYIVIAQDPATVLALYGVTALGPWIGGLSSDGDEIVLRDSGGVKIDGMQYGITAPWPVPPNGDGPTLELVNPNLDNDLGGHWRASTTTPAAVSYLTFSSTGWRYRKGTSEASAPLGAWRAEGFTEDGSWITGTMPIGFFNLNGTVQATNAESGVTLGTQLTDMASYSAPNFSVSYPSVFFRKTFTVAGAIPRALLLRVMHNDAAVVWINGVEVARFGFPQGSPTDPTFNTTNIYERGNDPWSELVLRDAATLLHAGTNTIAIQGFAKAPQLRATQEDNATYNLFDFCVDAELRNVPELLGTPGVQNSVFVMNGAPAIRDVQHAPSVPKSFEAVTITARVSDDQGIGSVQLAYQLCVAGSFIPATLPLTNAQVLANPNQELPLNPAFELPANWTTIPMVDDGSVAGDIPGDGLFTARIPAQPHRTLVRYRVTATDLASATVRVPGTDDPRKNYAYFAYNGVPDYVAGGQVYGAGVIDTLPVYHWITRASDFSSLLAYAGAEQFINNADLNVLRARRFENFEGALVVGDQVVDHSVTRLRGGNSRYVGTGKRHFRFKFPKGTPLAAADERGNAYARPWEEMLFNKQFGNKGYYDWGLPYEAGGKLWSLLGIPIPESHWIQFRVVRGTAEAPDATNGDFWGLYQALELPEGKNFLKARNLPLGNFFKMSDWTQNGEMDERYQAAGAPDAGEDFDNIRYNIHQTASDAFLKTYVNMPLWYRYQAAQEAMRHYDIFVEPTGRHRVKNLLWYFQPTPGTNGLGQVWFMPYDWDASFGPNWNNGWDFVHNAIYDHADIPDSPTWVLPKVSRTNTLQVEHRNAIRELRDLAWYRDITGRGPFDDMVDDAFATISAFWPADRARWPATGAQADHAGGAPFKVQDMKNFAFTGWTDPNGNGDPAVGAGGRAAYLDSISDAVDTGQLPTTPTITYTGAGGNPVDGITLQSTAFADPQGAGTFAAMQWRIGEITDPTAPAYIATDARIYELSPVWESGDITTFAAGIQVPASALRVGHTYRARVRHRDATGRWSHWSQPAQLTTTTANYLQVLKDNLMFSEMMYHPAGPSPAEASAGYLEGDFEYIELRNISNALTLDLTSVRFTKGIDFDFVGSAITSLAPGGRVLIVKNIAAFTLRHGAGRPIAGAWDSLDSLSNSGEEVKLSFGAGAAIHEFTYDDIAPWPVQADVGGYSLVLKTPETRPNHALGANWRASYLPGGTPGSDDRTTFTEWAAANTVSDPFGDEDGDGMGNQLEYALHGDPHVRDPDGFPARALAPFTVLGVPGDYLTLTFRRVLGAEDLTYTTQWSTDLGGWSTGGVLVSSTDHLDGTVTEVWRSPFPMTAAKTFGRLEIVRP